MRKASILTAVVFVAVLLPTARVAATGLTVSCRADLPVKVGDPMTWRASVQNATGQPTFSWSGTEGLSGTNAVATKAYATSRFVQAQVAVLDPATDETATADCGMHVLPASYVEPPSVTPVLWVPHGVDPAPLVPPLKRAWRSIHALFFAFYGKTFRMKPMKVIVSPYTETELCGGDCTDLKKADTLVQQAIQEGSSAIGGVVPYTRAMLVMAWGAGGWAGGWSWDLARGVIGDFAIAPAANTQIPAVEPDVGDWLLDALGIYDDAVYGSIAHELNHVIGWDDPHDFSLASPPNQYERDVSLAGPFLTRRLSDAIPPSVSFQSPGPGAILSGTVPIDVQATDDVAMDAVLLTVDQQFAQIDTSAPFEITLDTRRFGIGEHTLTAIALDAKGNMREASIPVAFRNQTVGGTCKTRFPKGTFRACFYDGIGTTGTYLGSWIEHPFPTPSSNVGYGVRHDFADEVAFGRTDHLTGVWRGTIPLPPGTYRWRFHADDGLQVWMDGVQVIDAWHAPQIADYEFLRTSDGPSKVKVRWFENEGGASLRFRWSPATPL